MHHRPWSRVWGMDLRGRNTRRSGRRRLARKYSEALVARPGIPRSWRSYLPNPYSHRRRLPAGLLHIHLLRDTGRLGFYFRKIRGYHPYSNSMSYLLEKCSWNRYRNWSEQDFCSHQSSLSVLAPHLRIVQLCRCNQGCSELSVVRSVYRAGWIQTVDFADLKYFHFQNPQYIPLPAIR